MLDKAQGQRIADLVHMAGSTVAQGLARKTVGLTELADGRIAVTISGKEAGLNPNQRRVAVDLLVKAGFEPDDVIMMDGVDDNPNYARPADRRVVELASPSHRHSRICNFASAFGLPEFRHHTASQAIGNPPRPANVFSNLCEHAW